MSAIAAHSVSAGAGAKTSAAPRLCTFGSTRFYRRSTTNKAPRKRTFLVVMTKFDSALAVPAGVSSAFASNVGMLAGGLCNEPALDMSGGDAGNVNGNSGNGRGDNGHQSGNFGDSSRIPHLFQAMLGAIALTAAIATFPAQSQATPSHVTSYSSGISTSRPRSKVVQISCKGSTLVVPLPSNGDIQSAAGMRLGPFSRTRIVDTPVVLSGREVALLDSAQYRVRESMRI